MVVILIAANILFALEQQATVSCEFTQVDKFMIAASIACLQAINAMSFIYGNRTLYLSQKPKSICETV
jgi:hypothetical protein